MVHHTKQIRTYFFLKVRSDFLFVMKSPVSAMVYSARSWRCCEWDKVHKESKRFPALFKRHILTTFFLSSLENLFFLDIQNAPFSAFSAFFTVRFEGSISEREFCLFRCFSQDICRLQAFTALSLAGIAFRVLSQSSCRVLPFHIKPARRHAF